MYGFDGVQRGNYFGGEPIKRYEWRSLRMEKLQVRMRLKELHCKRVKERGENVAIIEVLAC